MDESRPLCGPDGACVQCTADDLSVCTETTPLCDAATSLCVGCTAHDQCPGTACDKETGACFPSDCVLHIDSDGGQDYESISAALDGSMDEYRCVLVVHRPAAGATYSEDLEVGGRHIAILGEGIGRPRLASSQSEHVLSADSASVVYLSGLHVIQGQILVEYATVSIEDTDITNNFGPAIRTTSPSSRVKLENALIDGNDFLDEGAIALEAGDLEGVFSTVLGDDRALRCVPPAAAVVRNSLLLNSGDQLAVECPTFEATYSAFEVEYSGDGNQPLGEFQYEWFVFDDSVRRLSETSPALLAVTARWTTGDPTTDIDGDERPDRDGTMHYAGAWTADACQKVIRFVDTAQTFHLPVVYLADCPGFLVGTQAERTGTIRQGVRAIAAINQTTMPWCSIIVRNSFGVAGGAHRPVGRFSVRYAWISARWGSLPLEGGIEAAYRADLDAAPDRQAKMTEIEDRLNKLRSPFRSAETFWIEEIVDPRDTRPLLCEFANLSAPLRRPGPSTHPMRP